MFDGAFSTNWARNVDYRGVYALPHGHTASRVAKASKAASAPHPPQIGRGRVMGIAARSDFHEGDPSLLTAPAVRDIGHAALPGELQARGATQAPGSLYDKRSKSSYGAASSSSSRTTSSSAGGSRSYRGKPGRGVNPTDKERRSSRGADRTKVNDEDEANSPERKRARRKGKGAGKRVSVFSLLFR